MVESDVQTSNTEIKRLDTKKQKQKRFTYWGTWVRVLGPGYNTRIVTVSSKPCTL